MTMTTVKKILTAIAATILAIAAAQETGTLDLIPAKAMHLLTQSGILLGILGASPIGRLLFKDADTNDIVPPEAIRARKDLASVLSDVKPLVLVLGVLSALAASPGCATTKTGPVTGPTTSVPLQIAADCAVPAVRDLATHLLDDVASALTVSGDWHAALVNVAARAGADAWPAIKCAIGEIAARSDMQLAARDIMASDAVDMTQQRHDRAIAWLAEHPG